MNWLFVALPLVVIYLVWFGYLLFKKQYNRPLLYFALAHIPYLLVNLVAPFRGILDSNYAGYSMGWIELPKGIWVTLVVGTIVLGSLFFASRALMNKMDGRWTWAFIFDSFLFVLVAFPIFLDVISNVSAFTVELGEYLKISGVFVAVLILSLFTLPTFYACYFSGKNAFRLNASPSV